jgi:hypothetical protein
MTVARLTLVLAAAAAAAARAAAPGTLADQIASSGMHPQDYVLAKLREHRVVLLGEHHWIRQDAALVRDLVPRLAGAGVATLAMETLPASEQDRIDRLVGGATWDAAGAMAVLRAAAWPYREYLDIVRAVWETNRVAAAGSPPLRLLALGPGPDWRERLLPQGKTYDTFMAERVLAAAGDPARRVLVYCGVNHAFTRFEQPEMPRADRVERFMQRMGNVLRRELGEDVFLVMLHRPWRCREGSRWTACLPLGGAVDCAAAAGPPVGFDVAGEPAGDLPVENTAYYALGSPGLRFAELTDGCIWSALPGRLEAVGLIPLAEFAPDAASLAEVAAHNPFSDEAGLDRAAIQALWDEEAAALRAPATKFRWEGLPADPCAGGAAATPAPRP